MSENRSLFARLAGALGFGSSREGADGACNAVQGAVAGAAAAAGQSPLTGAPPSKIGSSEAANLPPSLARILRPAATGRWMMPNLGAITPQYIESVLRGAMAGNHSQQWELFDLMLDTWPELAACLAELVEGVMRKSLSFEPWCEEGEAATDSAQERQALVSAALRRMRPDATADENDMEGTLRDILSAWIVGASVMEIDWHRVKAGKLGEILAPRSTFWVHPSLYGWQDGRAVLTLPSGTQDFTPNKFLIAIHKAKSGPAVGNALLRPLAWWWCAANFASDWLLNLAQIFGLPFRWANYDPNAPQGTVDAICNMLQNMGSAAWAAFPAGTTLELKHENVSGDHSPQGELLDRSDRYARLLLLGQTMSGSQDSSKGGGKAFGAVESGVKADRIDAAGKFACSVFNNQLIPSVLILNYGNDDEPPSASYADETEAGVDDATRDSILAGIMPLSQEQLYEKYGMRKPVNEADATKPKAVAPPTLPAATGEVPGKPRSDAPEDIDPEAEAEAAEELAEKIAALSGIKDDAIYAKELTTLLDELK